MDRSIRSAGLGVVVVFAGPNGTTPVFRSLLQTFVPFGLLFTGAAVALTSSPRLENFTRLQPMRCFHVIYVIFFVMTGGLLGEYALRSSVWRWLALFVPLAASIYFMQQSQFPNSLHVELPGYGYRNQWISAFFWIRRHTPREGVFALDPNYMLLAGDDQHGFRAVAERSALADAVKDSGAVSLFPQLADRWKSQVQAQNGGEKFDRRDFERLAEHYPVTWILTRSRGPARMHVTTMLPPKYEAMLGTKGGKDWGVNEAGMKQMDDNIGVALAKLEEMGQLDNTIVVFTTDNGAEAISFPDGGVTPFKGQRVRHGRVATALRAWSDGRDTSSLGR